MKRKLHNIIEESVKKSIRKAIREADEYSDIPNDEYANDDYVDSADEEDELFNKFREFIFNYCYSNDLECDELEEENGIDVYLGGYETAEVLVGVDDGQAYIKSIKFDSNGPSEDNSNEITIARDLQILVRGIVEFNKGI